MLCSDDYWGGSLHLTRIKRNIAGESLEDSKCFGDNAFGLGSVDVHAVVHTGGRRSCQSCKYRNNRVHTIEGVDRRLQLL